MKERFQYFTYYDGVVYRLNCRTSKPINPSVVVYAIGIKLADADKKAILLEKREHGIKCYRQMPADTYSHMDCVTNLEREQVLQIITDMELKNIQQLPSIWVVELYDGSCMVIPEAKV